MIKEIVANIKTDSIEILFQKDNGYFDEEIIQTIELITKLNTWDKDKRFVVSCVLKPEKDKVHYHFYKVQCTNTDLL